VFRTKAVAAIVAATALAIPVSAAAATADSARAVASSASGGSSTASPNNIVSARVGEIVKFTQTTACTVACQNTWTWRDGSRLGVRMGSGYTVTRSWPTTGVKTVTVDLSESCVGSGGRLVCHSLSYVYVKVVA
jgi:hypothetical protein